MKKEFKESEDKLKIIYDNPKDIFKHFYIDFYKGEVYNRQDWEKGKRNPLGRKRADGFYIRIDIPCPNHRHIWSRGFVDVLIHRLIYYAHTGIIPEKVDHINRDVQYPNAITNLRESDSFHNRWNVANTSGRYRGVEFKYGYYWAVLDKNIINENGFISEILAVNCRNEYIVRMFLDKYGHLNNFPEKALDKIDENELFLDQMIQESIERTEEYKNKHIEIQKRKQNMKNKGKKKYKDLDLISIDPFEDIGRYE
jgi:hypothetical protein